MREYPDEVEGLKFTNREGVLLLTLDRPERGNAVTDELPFEAIMTGYGLTEACTCSGTRPGDDFDTIATGKVMKEELRQRT